MSDVRVRFAPSPTGSPHVGNIRSALFNWLYARHTGGTFILRVEDTDQKRESDTGLQDIMDSLRWLGLNWDEGPDVGGPYGPYIQSERLELYHRYAQQLLAGGHAYRCYCSPERLAALRKEQIRRKDSHVGYDRHCRFLSDAERAELEASGAPSVIRLAVPLEGQTRYHDLVHGDIVMDNALIDEQVLVKSDGFPTYHLANVVDDHHMRISPACPSISFSTMPLGGRRPSTVNCPGCWDRTVRS
jgi:glutamyl-tRNA synthetase